LDKNSNFVLIYLYKKVQKMEIQNQGTGMLGGGVTDSLMLDSGWAESEILFNPDGP
jgi:hypothetical protein